MEKIESVQKSAVLVEKVSRRFGAICAVYFADAPDRRCYILNRRDVEPKAILVVRQTHYEPLREASKLGRVFEEVTEMLATVKKKPISLGADVCLKT